MNVMFLMLPLIVDAARVRRSHFAKFSLSQFGKFGPYNFGKLGSSVDMTVMTDSSMYEASKCIVYDGPVDNETTMKIVVIGIDADCCKEVKLAAMQDEMVEEPKCVTQAKATKRIAMNGFDCDSKEAIKCGKEQRVIAKVGKSCCPFLVASLLENRQDVEPDAKCALSMLNFQQDGFCMEEGPTLNTTTTTTTKPTTITTTTSQRSSAPTLGLCYLVLLLCCSLVSQSMHKPGL